MRRALVAALLLGVAAPGWSQSAAEKPRLEANKRLVLDFFAFRGTREERAARFLADDYVQHNPRFLAMDRLTGAKGREAWVAAQNDAQRRGIRLVDLPGINLRSTPAILMAEGDLVTAIYRGEIPDPTEAGRVQEIFAMEVFRVRDGEFTEHWDQVTLAPGWMESGP